MLSILNIIKLYTERIKKFKKNGKFQILLTRVSRPTKITLNKLGVFTVSSLHAFICARSPSLLNNLLAGRGATKRKVPVLSRSNSSSGRRSLQSSTSRDDPEKTVKVSLPDNQVRHNVFKNLFKMVKNISFNPIHLCFRIIPYRTHYNINLLKIIN